MSQALARRFLPLSLLERFARSKLHKLLFVLRTKLSSPTLKPRAFTKSSTECTANSTLLLGKQTHLLSRLDASCRNCVELLPQQEVRYEAPVSPKEVLEANLELVRRGLVIYTF